MQHLVHASVTMVAIMASLTLESAAAASARGREFPIAENRDY